MSLATVHYKLPIIIAVLNTVRLAWYASGRRCFKKVFTDYTSDRGPDFVKLADAYGAIGIRVENRNMCSPQLKKLLTQLTARLLLILLLILMKWFCPLYHRVKESTS